MPTTTTKYLKRYLNLLTGLCIAVFFALGIFFPVQVVEAEHCTSPLVHGSSGNCIIPDDIGGPGVTPTLPDGTPVVSAPNPLDPNTPRDNEASGTMGAAMAAIWNFVAQLLYIFFVAIPVYIASLAGILLNATIMYLVVGMGDLINNQTGIGTAINNLWVVIRDVMNILFIFGLIYIGLKTIWNAEDSNTRKTLGLLIAAALLINFSLFISKAVVDFSNLAAVEICDLMSCRALSGTTGSALTYVGITGAFFDATGVATLVTQAQIEADTSSWAQVVREATTMFMVFILFVVLTIVFVGGAVMLFTRFVALILYMIFSPIMFLGWILPSFKKYSTDWWNGFFQKAFFAPLFLFMLYVSLITIRQMRAGLDYTDGGNAPYSEAISSQGGGGAFEIMLVYGFAIGMLVASMVVAKQFSMVGAGATMGALNGLKAFAYRNTVGRANNVRLGAQSWAYRNSMGRHYDRKIKKMDELENQIANGNAMERTAARIRLTRMKALSGNSTTAAMRKDAEAGRKYGAGGASFADQKDYAKSTATRAARAGTLEDIKTKIARGYNAAEGSPKRIEMERAIKDASPSQIVDIADSSEGKANLLKVAGTLSSSQVKSLMDSDKIDDTFKNKLNTERGKQITGRFTPKDATGKVDTAEQARLRGMKAGNNVSKATKSDIAALGPEYFSKPENALWLSEKQIDDSDFTDSDKTAIKAAREQGLKNVNASNPGAVFYKNLELGTEQKKDTDIASLPSDILKDTNAVPHITGGALKEMIKTQNASTRAAIRLNMNPGNGAQPRALAWLATPDATNF